MDDEEYKGFSVDCGDGVVGYVYAPYIPKILKQKYWYKTERYVCVICGCEDVYRERQYSERPEQWEKRNIFHQCACDDHFI